MNLLWLSSFVWAAIYCRGSGIQPASFENTFALSVGMFTIPTLWHYYRYRVRRAHPITAPKYTLLPPGSTWRVLKNAAEWSWNATKFALAVLVDTIILVCLCDWFLASVFKAEIGFLQMLGITLTIRYLRDASKDELALWGDMISAAAPPDQTQKINSVVEDYLETAKDRNPKFTIQI